MNESTSLIACQLASSTKVLRLSMHYSLAVLPMQNLGETLEDTKMLTKRFLPLGSNQFAARCIVCVLREKLGTLARDLNL
jgi:hypothetical protein